MSIVHIVHVYFLEKVDFLKPEINSKIKSRLMLHRLLQKIAPVNVATTIMEIMLC